MSRPLDALVHDVFPRADLATLPTPVEPLDLTDAVPSFRGTAWVKRDDATGRELGGNKVRKLEYLFGAAEAKGADRIVTVGGIGSNHCLASTFYAAERDLDVTLSLFPHDTSPSTLRTLRAICALAPRIRWSRSANLAATRAAAELTLARSTFPLLPGGSSPTGVLGFVNAGLELAAQIDAGELDQPDVVYCAYGSGGTAAGLALGLQLAGRPTRVRAVRVYPLPTTSRAWMVSLATRAYRRIEAAAPVPRFDPSYLRVVDAYLGDGYAVATEEGSAAMRTAAELGLTLEPTYTGKAFAAFLDAAGAPLRYSKLLFWLTYDPRIPEGLDADASDDIPEPVRELLSSVGSGG